MFVSVFRWPSTSVPVIVGQRNLTRIQDRILTLMARKYGDTGCFYHIFLFFWLSRNSYYAVITIISSGRYRDVRRQMSD